MKNFARLAALAVAATVTATPALAQSAQVPAGSEPQGRARIIKPLSLEALTDMNFGDITVEDTGVATVNALTGAVSCTGGLTCPGASSAATWRVRGTNDQWVDILKPATVTLTHTTSPGDTLTLNVVGQDDLQLSSSGMSGTDFGLGGNINVPATARDGLYEGSIVVTVQYQ